MSSLGFWHLLRGPLAEEGRAVHVLGGFVPVRHPEKDTLSSALTRSGEHFLSLAAHRVWLLGLLGTLVWRRDKFCLGF